MNIYWDRTNRVIVAALTSPARVRSFDLMTRDTIPLRLYVLTPQAGNPEAPFAQGELAVGESLLVQIKVKTLAGLDAAALAEVSEWSLVGAGTTAYYSGQLNLNVDTIRDYRLQMTTLSETELGEITVVDGDGVQFDSTQFDVVFYKDAIDQASAPTPVGSTARVRDYQNADGVWGLRFYNKTGELLSTSMPTGVSP